MASYVDGRIARDSTDGVAVLHTTLPESAQTALALRTNGRLTARQFADLFLEQESTVAQRIIRAIRRVRDADRRYLDRRIRECGDPPASM